jgi:dehydrogenase/reductase SDR family protein 7B
MKSVACSTSIYVFSLILLLSFGPIRVSSFAVTSNRGSYYQGRCCSQTHPGQPSTTTRVSVTAGQDEELSTADLYKDDDSMSLSVKDSTKEKLRGKTVFLTGASGGLGTALALQLAGCGVSKLIFSARKAESLQAVVDACQKINAQVACETVLCDLGNAQQVQATAAKAVAMGPVDVLINNGGVSSRSGFLETSLAVDEMVMQINFLAGAALAKALIPGMVAQQDGGRLIWISSVQGLVGIPDRSSYAASKFAVQGYTESIRAELQSSGVSVHTVSPGYIRTNLSNSALTGDGTAHGQTGTFVQTLYDLALTLVFPLSPRNLGITPNLLRRRDNGRRSRSYASRH